MFNKKYIVSYIVDASECSEKYVHFDEIVEASCVEEVIFKIKAKVEKLNSKANVDFTKIEIILDD